MLFLCYSRCSTCKKAQKWLDEQGIAYTQRDIKEDNPTLQELETWHQASSLPLKKFFNTSGQLYRALSLSKKLPDMTQAEQYALLASDGMLITESDSGKAGWPGIGERLVGAGKSPCYRTA